MLNVHYMSPDRPSATTFRVSTLLHEHMMYVLPPSSAKEQWKVLCQEIFQ